ncbi:hypothetical protein ABZZ79_31305 [Streptomyces sp. NPDC006458]|uniref:hypothetical protein n=1 Tax=Streptomyces sp. NPDC006458 TaxID=3154302 RepID=UPI0033A2CD02
MMPGQEPTALERREAAADIRAQERAHGAGAIRRPHCRRIHPPAHGGEVVFVPGELLPDWLDLDKAEYDPGQHAYTVPPPTPRKRVR